MTVQTFQGFARSLDPDIAFTSPRSFEMVFAEEGLNARVTLSPDDRSVVTDIFVVDASLFYGGVRRALMRAILTINGIASANSTFSVGLDGRSFVVLVGRSSIDRLTAADYSRNLMFWLEQAQRLRDCAQALSFQGGEHTFEFEAAS